MEAVFSSEVKVVFREVDIRVPRASYIKIFDNYNSVTIINIIIITDF